MLHSLYSTFFCFLLFKIDSIEFKLKTHLLTVNTRQELSQASLSVEQQVTWPYLIKMKCIMLEYSENYVLLF